MMATGTVAAGSVAADSITVAALKGVDMSPSFEHVELYGMESVMRAAVAKHSLKVKVSCKYAMWDPAADTILNWVMTGGSTTEDFTAGTAETTGLDNEANKNKVGLFTMSASVRPADSNTLYYTVTAHDIYFEGVPFALTENEFIVRDLSGTAKFISITKSGSGW